MVNHFSIENPMNSMKRQKDVTLIDEHPRSVTCAICYWRRDIAPERLNSSRNNKEAEPKWKQCPVMEMCLVVKANSDAVKNNIA